MNKCFVFNFLNTLARTRGHGLSYKNKEMMHYSDNFFLKGGKGKNSNNR